MNRLSFVTILVVVPGSTVLADILNVPGDYPTIQEAIDSAVDGDEVVVADGVYTGSGNKNLNFHGKLITVRSENGPSTCTIDCEGAGRGFIFENLETASARVEGFPTSPGRMSPTRSSRRPSELRLTRLPGPLSTVRRAVRLPRPRPARLP
jgi:hypothetical protein